MKMPVSALILIILNVVLAALALYGGINLLLDTSGTNMQIDPAMVYIPFVSDFFWLAIWLVVAFAALPVILSFLIYTDRKIGVYGSFALAALEILWIGTQVYLFYSAGFSFWWPVIMGYGLVVTGIVAASLYLMFRASARNYFHWYAPRTHPPVH